MAEEQKPKMQDEGDKIVVARLYHGIVIATPERDAFWDRVKIHQVRDKLVRYLDAKKPPALIMDLEKVDKISSEAIGVLLKLRDHTEAQDLQLRLCNLQAPVREVLDITELTPLFQIYESLPQAYRGLLPEQ
ncbi:MAG: STAS domain-containing protein [Planctomycetes bacterium]|nr:STAS domain-containing protein [Planctomycetota bacterium]